jgi:hypothetical protein
MTPAALSSQLRAAAGGVVGDRRTMAQRRGHLYDLIRVADHLRGDEARPVRELARTLSSEARRTLRSRRRGWLHAAVAGLALDLARELAPRETPTAAVAAGPAATMPPTSRCAACGAVVAGGRRLCFPHWRLVPRELQRALLQAGEGGEVLGRVLEAIGRARGTMARRPRARRPPEFCTRPRGHR